MTKSAAALAACLALLSSRALAQSTDMGARAETEASGARDGWSGEVERGNLEQAMKRLDDRLARMDQRLRTEEIDRRARIKALVARAERHAQAAAGAVVRQELRPERIKALTERALAEARAGEAAAQAAEQSLRELQPRLDDLSRRLDHLDEDLAGQAPPT